MAAFWEISIAQRDEREFEDDAFNILESMYSVVFRGTGLWFRRIGLATWRLGYRATALSHAIPLPQPINLHEGQASVGKATKSYRCRESPGGSGGENILLHARSQVGNKSTIRADLVSEYVVLSCPSHFKYLFWLP